MFRDNIVKNLVREYQKTGQNLSTIIEYIAPYIYNYPKIVWKVDEDTCSDFFIYFFTRFDNLLLKYKVFDCQFKTWLTVVLRMHYMNWRKSNFIRVHSCNDYLFYLCNMGVHDSFIYNKEIDVKFVHNLSTYLEKLPEKIRFVLKLYAIDFIKGKDFIDISSVFNIKLNTLIARWSRILLELSEKSFQQEQYIKSFNRVHYYIINIQNQLKRGSLSLLEEQKLEKKLLKYKKQKQNLQKKLYRCERLNSSVIGNFLGISSNQVDTLLHRGKLLLRKYSCYSVENVQ